jgi:glycosyltransferase involved in cell wall biosynthesis
MWHGLAKEFAKRGHEVTVFARAFPGQPETENRDGIRILRWGGYDQGTSVLADLVRCFWYALRAVGRLPEGDILVTNDFWMPVFAARRKEKCGKVVINANRFPKGQYGIYGGADLVAAASGAVAEAIKKQTPELTGRIKVVPNAVDAEFLRDSGVRGLRGSETGKVTVLYVGRIHPEKGVNLLLEAWERLSEMKIKIKGEPRLRIVGPWKKGQGGAGAEYLSKLKEKRLKGVAWEDPNFQPSVLAKIYRDADLFVYPSLAEKGESFGVAPLEAMACGTAVLISDLEVFRDYLRPGWNGWKFNHRRNPEEALARGIVRALGKTTRSLRSNAVKTAESFSPKNVASLYLQSFTRLIHVPRQL